MNSPGDIPITNGTTTAERPCGLTSLIPTIGMSCRGRAEAFARRLQSKLRTLGSQSNDDSPTGEEDPIIGLTNSTWVAHDNSNAHVTNHQPLRSTSTEADSFFDFDCELESPGSPVDECEYSRLIETASTTPHDCAPESGYICSSPISSKSHDSSHSSSEEPFFDPESSDADQRSLPTDYYDCEDSKKENSHSNTTTTCYNGHLDDATQYHQNDSSESLSDSLPPSQESTSANTPSLTQSSSTFTGITSASNSTLQDIVLGELQQHSQNLSLQNGHHEGPEDVDVAEECIEVSDTKVEDQTEDTRREETLLTNGHAHISELNDSESVAPPSQEVESQRPIQLEVSNKSEVSSNKKHLTSSDTDDEEDCRPQRVRRCSSLKTGKTPPGTPGRKKIVRFADVLGLDLADVKTFLDEIPTVPKSAYEDLEIADTEPPIQLGPRMDKILMPLFQQPGGLPSFLDIVREKQVCLENAAVTDPVNMTITGCVRVRNLDFHKSVYIRYTLDSWRSFADLQATYVPNSCDGFSDKFSFVIFGNSMRVGQRLEFTPRFHCKGQQYWDNNYGTNYCFQCLPATNPSGLRAIAPLATSPILSSLDSWCSGSFY